MHLTVRNGYQALWARKSSFRNVSEVRVIHKKCLSCSSGPYFSFFTALSSFVSVIVRALGIVY